MTVLILTVTGILVGMGLLLILLDLFRVPYLKSSSSVATLAKKQRNRVSLSSVILESVEIRIAGLVRMNEYKRERLAADLISAQLELTPERYLSRAVVQAMLIGILALPAALFHPILSAAVLAAAFAVYRNKISEISRKLRQKREDIEYELAAFVFSVEKTLHHDRDVLFMIESYAASAGDSFKRELEITAADMRSGNYEDAITRLDTRIGSTLMSDVCRGLISILRGDETIAYWATMETRLCTYQRELLKRRAQKIPRKVRRLSMILLFCFIATFFTVILYQIVLQLTGVF